MDKSHIVACVLIIIISTITAHAYIPYESRILAYYSDVVSETQDHGLSGPIAKEIAQFALLRRIHEDGLGRDTNICMNGMVPGSPNKEVIESVYMPECELFTTTANDGQGCYVIEGPRANVKGAVAISLWYDAIINSDRFRVCNKQERKVWNLSKHHSHMIAIGRTHPKHKLRFRRWKSERIKILKKVNKAYGPAGEHINNLRNKFKSMFTIATAF